ncbi:MAG TPA: Gfo/Idh/MocA family oxidoreductase [Clostridium sp.]
MLNGEKLIERPLRWAMVGGGRTGQVGYKHRTGALRDNTAYSLVAGAFDIDAERGREFGVNIEVAPERCYPNYKTMFEEESKREDGIEVVSIATPNGSHYEITKAALNAGIHVICEKPLFFTSDEVREVKALAETKGKIVGVTYGFSGFQILLQARKMIEMGDLGDIRLVNLQYTHGFNATAVEKDNSAAKWRVNPNISGPSYVLGDLSTHTYYISELLLPKLKIKKLMCDRQSFIKSRAPLEDNAHIIMHYDNGAVGTMWVSAVNAGCHKSQGIRIVGTKASIEWWDSNPSQLRFEEQGKPNQIMFRGMPYFYEEALEEERLGALHEEGLSESWANIYLKFARAIDAKNRGDEEFLKTFVYPDINAGLDGVRWIENCVRSANNGSSWVDFE